MKKKKKKNSLRSFYKITHLKSASNFLKVCVCERIII